MTSGSSTQSPLAANASDGGRAPDIRLPKPTRGNSRGAAAAVSIAIGASIIGFAELSARQDWISTFILPAPSSVAHALWTGFTEGRYLDHTASTMSSTVVGFLISAMAALTLAGLLASFPFFERVLVPYVVALQSLPKVAIAPLLVIWLGFGTPAKTAMVVVVSFFPILVNGLQGFRVRQREHLDLMLILGGSRFQVFRYIRFPASLPYVFSGLHVGVIFALIGAVVAEFISSNVGLGYALLAAQSNFDTAGVFAILIVLMAIGMMLNAVMRLIEAKVTFWARDLTTVGL